MGLEETATLGGPSVSGSLKHFRSQQARAAGLKNHERLSTSIMFAVCCNRALVSIVVVLTTCEIFRTCTIAICTSCCVNLSSRTNASSTSLLPINFFRYLSESLSATGGASSRIDSLVRPCLISFVTIPNIPSTSTIIFTIVSFIASVVGTSLYSSSRLKKLSMRSKISMSASWLAATSFAACVRSVSG
ncbi:hypothetical protein EDB83DRAFT_928791 [Lactarius deliciosus]|nr:hypothetical protein EDB83DRAFT_928791 [Lactarius deliciosus]